MSFAITVRAPKLGEQFVERLGRDVDRSLAFRTVANITGNAEIVPVSHRSYSQRRVAPPIRSHNPSNVQILGLNHALQTRTISSRASAPSRTERPFSTI